MATLKLRFSTIDPHEVAQVAALRDMHRGTTPTPPHLGGVPDEAARADRTAAAVSR